MQWDARLPKKLTKISVNFPMQFFPPDKLREEFGQATFSQPQMAIHGRGVAWAARRLGQKAVVRHAKGHYQNQI